MRVSNENIDATERDIARKRTILPWGRELRYQSISQVMRGRVCIENNGGTLNETYQQHFSQQLSEQHSGSTCSVVMISKEGENSTVVKVSLALVRNALCRL